MPIKDNRKKAAGLNWHTLPVALLHHLPVLSGEQAVTLKEGQEIVGTRSVTAAPATSWRKLHPENNVTNSANVDGGENKPGGKLENNEEVDVTPLLG